MDELHNAGIAVYAIYSEITLVKGLSLMGKYFGTLPDMYSNKTSLNLEFAPRKLLVNLETMELITMDSAGPSGFETFDMDDALEACKKL